MSALPNDSETPNPQNEGIPERSKFSTKRSHLANKAKAGFASFQHKLKRMDSNKAQTRLSMPGLLKQARLSLEKWVATHQPHNYPMPNGIVFLTSVKGSFGWGGELGTGIVLYRLNNSNNSNNNEEKQNNSSNSGNNNRWSGPCAIGSGGVSFGFQIGISKVDHIVMLPLSHHVRTFTSKGQLKLGGTSELTVVNVGAKAQGSFNIGSKEMSDIHSYSQDTKGLSIGVSVEGAVITVRGDCNCSFYGRVVTVEEIAKGNVQIPENHRNNPDYLRMVDLLNSRFKVFPRRPQGPPPRPPLRHVHRDQQPAIVASNVNVGGELKMDVDTPNINTIEKMVDKMSDEDSSSSDTDDGFEMVDRIVNVDSMEGLDDAQWHEIQAGSGGELQ